MHRSNEAFSMRGGFIAKWLVVLTAITGVTIPVLTFAVPEKFPIVPDAGFSVVTQGPMELLITQSGELDSADNDILISKCEWKTRVLSIIPEGSWVETGDIIAELDASNLREMFQERAIRLVTATARLTDAREDLQIQSLINESLLAKVELKGRLSKLKLDSYIEAEHPQQLHELEAALALAEEDLSRTRKKHEFVEGMARLGYRTSTQRETERINVLKKTQAYSLAEDKLNVLKKFTYHRTLTQLTAVAKEANRETERVKLAAKASILRREITVRSRERSYRIYKDYQDRLEKNIAACTIIATKPGEVIYAKKSSRSSNRIDEGSSIRYLQAVATIPDRNRLQVKLRLHESNIRLIKLDQQTLIQVDAAGEQTYSGHVSQISTVPLSGRYPNYDLREYRVTIDLDADPEVSRSLSPGMTATVNIIAEHRNSTLQTSVQSIVQVGDEYIAFVHHGDEVQHRVIEIGIASDSQIEILSGLEEGEEVVAKPRVTCAQRIVSLEKEFTGGQKQSYWLSMVE